MSLDPCFSLFLSECLYQSPAILSLVVFVYMYVSSSMFPLCLSLWMLVLMSGYIIIYCMPTCTSLDPPWYNRTGWLGVKHQFTYVSWSVFLSFPLKVCVGARLYYNPLYVYMYVSWSVFLSVFLLTVCISVLLYYHLLYVYMYVVSGPRGAVPPSGREETLPWVALSTPRELPWVTWPWWPCHKRPCHEDLAMGDLATETLSWRFSHGDFSMETMPPWRRCHGRSRHGDLAMGDLAMETLPWVILPWRFCRHGDLAMEILPWETIELVSSLKHVLYRRWKKSKYTLAIGDFVLKVPSWFYFEFKKCISWVTISGVGCRQPQLRVICRTTGAASASVSSENVSTVFKRLLFTQAVLSVEKLHRSINCF